MAGVIYNITSRKILENQKDEFFGIASHEFKTPVTSIKAYAEVLQEMAVETRDPNSAPVVEKLNRQVDRLTDLINNLLDTTKIFEGQLTIHREEFNINELIVERVEDMQPLTRKNKMKLDRIRILRSSGRQGTNPSGVHQPDFQCDKIFS